MFVNRFRSLYSFSSIKPASLFPLRNTRWARCLGTESKSDLKPEDTFGDYVSNKVSHSPEDCDEDDIKGDGMRISDAIFEIKKCIRVYDFDQAKEVFDELVKRKRPPAYIYKLLFVSAAKLGKAEEAYKLYNDLKKRGLYADGAMFTSLFYACANCQRRDIALPMADKIMRDMFESKEHKPNSSNFNVMLMAYGKHGDISTVMQIIDTLEEEGRKLNFKTLNLALETCIALPNNGLRFAILIWHHMLKKRIAPNSFTFVTLARCIRDCSLGDSDLCEGFINSLFENRPRRIASQSPKDGKLVINLEKESQTFIESDQRGSDVKGFSGFLNNNDSKQSGTVLVVDNNQAEMLQSTGDVSLNDGNDEKTKQHPFTMKVESSNDFGPATGSNEESQCTNHILQAAPEKELYEKAVTLITGNNKELIDASETADGIKPTEVQPADEFNSEVATPRFDNEDLPNVLTLKPPGKAIMRYGDFSIPENRLMLFGGLNGFLETVKSYRVKPNVRLFSVLLECIPSTEEDEEALLTEMKKYRVKVDTTFLNILIKRRLLRNKDSTPEDFLALFEKYGRAPDVVTFGTIARSCVTHESGKKCIELARSHNVRLNSITLKCLLERAGKARDMDYVSDIIKAAKEDGTELDAKFVTTLKFIVENEKKRRKSISQ